MPFLSKDWRSTGEKWVRFEGGWEMKKTVWATQKHFRSSCSGGDDSGSGSDPEVGSWGSDRSCLTRDADEEENEENRHRGCQNHHHNTLPGRNRTTTESCSSRKDDDLFSRQRVSVALQPFCPITVKNTKEVAGFNALANALLRLDFIAAVRDIRRFNYVSKIMYTLFSHDRLIQLPGASQKVLFMILEEMADTVYKNNHSEHVLRKLLDELHATMTIYHVWGSHLGSSNLFRQHAESRRKIIGMVEMMQVKYKQDLAISCPRAQQQQHPPGLVSLLPEECIREILLRLSDPKDLESAADTCLTMNTIAKERRVWRELVQTHFTKQQIEFVIKDYPDLRDHKDWRQLYKRLRWRFGLKEEYTETLMLCRKCVVLFWQSIGHPCLILAQQQQQEEETGNEGGNGSRNDNDVVSISPKTFLSFFSV